MVEIQYAMNKMKYLLMMIMAAMVSASCADDNDFFNLVGSWENRPFPNNTEYKMRHPDESFDDCEKYIIITFNKDLTGNLDKDNDCNPDYELVGFKWRIKGDQLTITFDQQSENNWDIIAGTNTFDISGNILTIKGDDGTITELTRYNLMN